MQDYPIAALGLALAATYLLATLAASCVARFGFPAPPALRIGCIDGLRGYLALSVLTHHFIIWLQITRLGGSWTAPSVNLFNQLGGGGVALFFMTTGCVFYPRVLAGWRRTSWTATYITRIARIVPLTFFSILAVGAIITLRGWAVFNGGYLYAMVRWLSGYSQPALLGYGEAWRIDAGVLWSLWWEWMFYVLVLPICALAMDLIRERLPSWALPLSLLVAAMINEIFGLVSLGGLEHFLSFFAMGMLAFECQREPALRRIFAARWIAVPALAVLVLEMLSFRHPFGPAQVILFGFFFICVACGNDLFGLLRTNGALVLGECSFSIYLLHGIVLDLMFVEGAPLLDHLTTPELPAVLPLAGLLVALLTPLTYLAIERPAIRLGSRLAKAATGARVQKSPSELEVAP